MAQAFRKYEFTDAQWATARKKIEVKTTNPEGEPVTSWDTEKVAVVVELGKLCTEWGTDEEGMPVCVKQSSKVSVDIVWNIAPLSDFASAIVWPLPVGVSSMGYSLDKEYAEAYCIANPDAAYCQPPTPIEL